MPAKIATSEDLQTELRTLWAMTEEETPSREKLAAAIGQLAQKVSAGESLAGMVGNSLEEWAESVGNAIISKSQGLGGLRVRNEWTNITVLIKGARNNQQEIIFEYALNSVEMITVVLGSIEGHKISGLRFIVNTYDSPDTVANKFTRAIGRYMEENSL
jgi:hypothetical protein